MKWLCVPCCTVLLAVGLTLGSAVALAAVSPLTWAAPVHVDGHVLSTVSCPNNGLCVAVDQSGNVVTSSNPTGGATTWTVVNVDGSAYIGGVACTSSGLCVAVTQFGDVVSSTNPTGGATAWTVAHVDGSNFLDGVSCPSTGLCVAVDQSGNVVTSTNPTGGVAAWTVTSISGGAMISVSCPSTTLCVAVNVTGNVLISTNPTGGATAWTATSVTGTNSMDAVSCSGSSFCIAADQSGNVITSSNPTGGATAWTVTDVDGSNSIFGVSCPSSGGLCVAVDDAGNVVASTNPTGGAAAWTVTHVDSPTLDGVSCPSINICVVTDGGGNVVIGTFSTTTAVASSSNPSTVGSSVTYTATVSATPDGGTVAFTDNATTLTGCGAVPVNTGTGTATCTTSYSAIGYHAIDAYYSGDANYAASSGLLTQYVNEASTGSAYTALTPNRILDTRISHQTLGSGGSLNLTVAGGTTGVPSTATGVIFNVTVTGTTANSFLTIWPAGRARPATSNLDWVAGDTRPNLVNVPVGAGDQVSIYNAAGKADVLIDEEGFFAAPSGPAGGYDALSPARLLDTRLSHQTMNTGSLIDLQITGAGGVPATGVAAVVLNVTATNTTTAGLLTLYPSGDARPTASNVNWVAGWTIANRVIVKVGTGGKVSIYNAKGSADVVVDVNGYFTDATASGEFFTPLSPVRVLDTRVTGGTLGPKGIYPNFQVTGSNGVPRGASAVFLNTTVTKTTASSVLTVYPNARPTASDLNWKLGQTISNLTLATLSSSGTTNFYNAAGSTDLVLDLSGYFSGVSIIATPSSIPADGSTTSNVDVTVIDSNGNPVALDPVSFALTPSVAGACGTLIPSSGTTNGAGKLPTATYTASTTVGTCTIAATESLHAEKGTATITQSVPPNVIALVPHSDCTDCAVIVNAGGSTLTFSTRTTNEGTGLAVQGDRLTFTASPSSAGSCGTIGSILPTGGISDTNGNVTFVYTSSSVVGFCTIKATESAKGATKLVVVTQANPADSEYVTISGTTSSTATCSGGETFCVFANGNDTGTIKVIVIDATTTGQKIGDGVLATFFSASPAGACGSISPTGGSTIVGGFVTSYTASTTAGTCDITFTEADDGSTGHASIQQDPVP